MSSSKGLGLKAHDLVEILPPNVARFLFAKNGIKSQSNFDPADKNGIPTLFDDYQKAAEAYFSKSNDDLARAFELSQIGEIEKPPSVRFSILTQWVQMPNMEEEIKKQGLEEWAKYARVWVERFAPEDMKFTIQEELPEIAKELNEKQKDLLSKTSELVSDISDAAELQTKIYELGKELGLPSSETFEAFYKVLIGKNHGPKLAWLILSLDKEFIIERFESASR